MNKISNVNKIYIFHQISMDFECKPVSSLIHHRLKFQPIWFSGSWDITNFMWDRYKKYPCIAVMSFSIQKFSKMIWSIPAITFRVCCYFFPKKTSWSLDLRHSDHVTSGKKPFSYFFSRTFLLKYLKQRSKIKQTNIENVFFLIPINKL